MRHEIQHVDPISAPEELLYEMWEYYQAVYKEDLPDDPVIPAERQILDWRAVRMNHIVDRYVVRAESGEIVAVGVAFRDTEQNLDNAHARIHVREDMRGQGIARELGIVILESLEKDGRTRISSQVKEGSPTSNWLESLGLKMAIREKRSRLLVSDVDRNQMRSWIDRASERASDYELQFFTPPFPDAMAEKYAELLFQLNTAPMDDYEMDDEVYTSEMIRDKEAKTTAQKTKLHTYIAVHKPTGAFAGSSTVEFDHLWPEQAWQWETVTHPEHRNKGIGRWLKAAMIEKLDDFPDPVERIDTYNAGSNEAMLNINVAMGFKPILIISNYQGDLVKALEILSS